MEEKMFFNPGDLVQLKQDLPNKPVMIVVRKETITFHPDKDEKDHDKKSLLMGIRCRWFTTTGELQEARFSTKDLILV